MQNMMISVITINYNNKDGLQKTINSVISQTYRNFEWIIIDGGSTDGSRELIKQYSNDVTYWVSESDRGIYNAMNKGIKEAKGDYLLFLNSGDCLATETVMENVANLELEKDFAYGIIKIVTVKGAWSLWDIPLEDITGRRFLRATLPHPATFIKRSMFTKFGMYDENYKICADWKFFMDAILFGQASIQKIPFVISVFFEGGISTKDWLKKKQERERAISLTWSPLILKDYEKLEVLNVIQKYTISRFILSQVLAAIRIWEKVKRKSTGYVSAAISRINGMKNVS